MKIKLLKLPRIYPPMKNEKLRLLIKRFKKIQKKKLTTQDRIFLGIGVGIMAAVILFTAYIIWFIWSQKSVANYRLEAG